jgi:hypothetical protein
MFILNMWTASLENGFFYNHNTRLLGGKRAAANCRFDASAHRPLALLGRCHVGNAATSASMKRCQLGRQLNTTNG